MKCGKEKERRRCMLVKIGGSSITDKNTFETLKEDVLLVCANHIKQAVESVNSTNSLNYGLDIIVIHGAGSFGHFQAHDYGVSKGGIKNDNGVVQWKKGFAMTRDSVTSLNRIVVHTLVHQCNLPAVGVSPFPNAICCGNKRLHPEHTSPLSTLPELLDTGLLPVLHGDAVLDTEHNCTIFGGDHIIRWLCTDESSMLAPSRIVFLTDVAGIYTCSPDETPNGCEPTLIREITVDDSGSFQYGIVHDESVNLTSRGHDVTGGIKEKLSCIAEIVQHAKGDLEVFIVQAGTQYALAALCGDYPHVCTKVSYLQV